MLVGEIETIRNIVARLKSDDLGCAFGPFEDGLRDAIKEHNERVAAGLSRGRLEVASRLYLNTWIIPALEALLPETRDLELAQMMSR